MPVPPRAQVGGGHVGTIPEEAQDPRADLPGNPTVRVPRRTARALDDDDVGVGEQPVDTSPDPVHQRIADGHVPFAEGPAVGGLSEQAGVGVRVGVGLATATSRS